MVTISVPRREVQPQEALEFSNWHERCIEYLFSKSGYEVKREPQIMGKTPDMLVTPQDSQPFVVECIARLQDPDHALELTETGLHVCSGNIKELHQNIYSRLEQKATKYRNIAETMPYVIAFYDASCMNGIDTAVDLVLSPFAPTIEFSKNGAIKDKHYNSLWYTSEIPVALFELYPHLSGFIYSCWPGQHYYLPNPFTTNLLSNNIVQFAEIPSLPTDFNQSYWTPSRNIVMDDFESPPITWQSQIRLLHETMA